MRSVTLALILVVGSSPAPGHVSAEPVTEVQQLRFYSAFWPNLHNVLWSEAWARRPASDAEPSPAGKLPEPLSADLAEAERGAWDGAVAYYDREIADLHPLFDRESRAIRMALLEAGSELPATGLAPEHRRVLTEVAAVYRKYWWPAHDRANREWIAEARSKVTALSPEVPEGLARLYATPWFAAPLRVDVVRVSSREGAFTSNEPAPGHITISSSSPGNQEWAAAEVLFHEASHLLFLPAMRAFGAELKAQGKNTRDGPAESWNVHVWHAALFYSTGEVVRRALEARGIRYQPYAYKTGLFDRSWSRFRALIEAYWKAFVDGHLPQDEAIRQIVSGLQ